MNLKIGERLMHVLEAFRVWLPTASQDARRLAEEVREDPRGVLQSTAVRVGIIMIGGLTLVLIVYKAGIWLAPPVENPQTAEVVPFRVKCLNPQCEWSKAPGTVNFEIDFNDWPTTCPKCQQKTLYPYVCCHNKECRKWVVPKILEDGTKVCPRCGAKL
ncbi:MAG: hypothetical protein JXQ73_11760 [Phycisphaerae bacterium]|nr:hypothetical protein [Phycisphaerae bacterium]